MIRLRKYDSDDNEKFYSAKDSSYIAAKHWVSIALF